MPRRRRAQRPARTRSPASGASVRRGVRQRRWQRRRSRSRAELADASGGLAVHRPARRAVPAAPRDDVPRACDGAATVIASPAASVRQGGGRALGDRIPARASIAESRLRLLRVGTTPCADRSAGSTANGCPSSGPLRGCVGSRAREQLSKSESSSPDVKVPAVHGGAAHAEHLDDVAPLLRGDGTSLAKP